jgi:hypothetical protein
VRLYHKLEHRHLVRLDGAFVSRGDLCIVLDYAMGGTVEHVVAGQRGRAFETCFVTDWLAQRAPRPAAPTPRRAGSRRL